jgi:PAS domain S-box-containing protein
MAQAEPLASNGSPEASGSTPPRDLRLLLSLQNTAARVLAGAMRVEDAVPKLIEVICRNLGFPLGSLWVLDGVHQVLRCQSLWGSPAVSLPAFEAATRERTFELGIGLPGRVWSGETAIWVPDVTIEPNFPRAAAAEADGVHGALAFPIRAEREFFGVMEFFSQRVLAPDAELLSFIEGIGNQVGQLFRRVKAQEATRQSEARMAAVVEAALDCVVAIDHRGRITEFNPAAERTFRLRHQDVIGKDLADLLIPPVFREQFRHGLAHYLKTGENRLLRRRLEMPALRGNGEEFPVEIAISPISANGMPSFTAYIRDISIRKQAEAEFELTAKFRDQLLGILGHDLRNPLQAIRMATSLLFTRGGLNQRQSKTLARISVSTDRMARMINDLLDFARSRLGGAIPLERRPTDLADVAHQVIEELTLANPSRIIQLSTYWNCRGEWDPDRLAQVLSNLVGNALQHSPEDSPIQVELDGDASSVVFEVRNGGNPIPPDVLPVIFEPYRRGISLNTTGGVGLGLYIVKQVVSAHGGTVEVRSSAEHGTTFSVRLPKYPPNQQFPLDQPRGGEEFRPGSGTQPASGTIPFT